MRSLIVIAGAGLIAGMMNALAGGGSFVTLPALIAAGVPSVNANTSSTVALFPGTLMSAWAYTLLVSVANTIAVLIFIAAQSVRWREALVMLAAATLGGYCGALVGRRAPAAVVRAGTLQVSVGITLAFFARAYL